MAGNADRARALVTLLKWRGGSITLARDDMGYRELQGYLQQMAADGLVEMSAGPDAVTFALVDQL